MTSEVSTNRQASLAPRRVALQVRTAIAKAFGSAITTTSVAADLKLVGT